MSLSLNALPEHQKGLLLTTFGVLVLTPDSLLVRLADMDPFALLVWRGVLQAVGILVLLALFYPGKVGSQIRSILLFRNRPEMGRVAAKEYSI